MLWTNCFLFFSYIFKFIAKHREERDKKEKEKDEVRNKEDVEVKPNHLINESFCYNHDIKPDIKEVK